MTKVSVFSVQVSASMFLFPDTRHLTPETLRFVLGVWDFIDSITPADSRISSRSILQTIDCKFPPVLALLRARSQKL
jgi:hypothetical protein